MRGRFGQHSGRAAAPLEIQGEIRPITPPWSSSDPASPPQRQSPGPAAFPIQSQRGLRSVSPPVRLGITTPELVPSSTGPSTTGPRHRGRACCAGTLATLIHYQPGKLPKHLVDGKTENATPARQVGPSRDPHRRKIPVTTRKNLGSF